MEQKPAPIGHNNPSLEDRIFVEDVTVEDVLEAVLSHVTKSNKAAISEISGRTKELVKNTKKIPDALNEDQMRNALELIADIGQHNDRVAEVKDEIIASTKKALADLNAICKPLDAGLAVIDKKLRPLMTDYLIKKLDDHNAERSEDEEPMRSITERGPSGSKATYTDGYSNIVVNPDILPRELMVPDQKLVDKAMENAMKEDDGKSVEGVERQRAGTLRVSK